MSKAKQPGPPAQRGGAQGRGVPRHWGFVRVARCWPYHAAPSLHNTVLNHVTSPCGRQHRNGDMCGLWKPSDWATDRMMASWATRAVGNAQATQKPQHASQPPPPPHTHTHSPPVSTGLRAVRIAGAGLSLRGKKKTPGKPTEKKIHRDALCFMAMGPSLLQGSAVGGWRRLAVGG